MKRRTQLRRTSSPIRRRRHAPNPGDLMALLVHFGNDPRCAFPGCTQPASVLHHRKLRSRGGTDDVDNLVPLCQGAGTPDHHGHVHRNPAEAEEMGLIEASWE